MSIDVNYYSFSPSRANEGWLKYGKKNVVEFLSKYPSVDEKELLHTIIETDLEYGAVVDAGFEDPKLEYLILNSIIKDYSLDVIDEVPARDGWLTFFSTIKEHGLEGVVSLIMADTENFNVETAREILKEFLISISPVIQDLKNTEDSVFYRSYAGDGGEPKAIEKLLQKRAELHISELTKI